MAKQSTAPAARKIKTSGFRPRPDQLKDIDDIIAENDPTERRGAASRLFRRALDLVIAEKKANVNFFLLLSPAQRAKLSSPERTAPRKRR